VAVCEGHESPLATFWDIASGSTHDALIIANRGGTKTMGLAALAVYMCVTHPSYEVVLMCAGLNQVAELLRHARAFASRLAAFDSSFTNILMSAERIIFPNGSSIQVRAATLRGSNAPHPHMCIFDEVECFEDMTIIEEALSMAMDDAVKGYPGVNIFSSSRKFRFGIIQRLLDEADQRGLKVYVWCVFETMAPCDNNCLECEGVASAGMSFKTICGGRGRFSMGYIPKGHVLQEFKRLSLQTFEAQWLSLRPPPIGAVFPQFGEEHILRGEASKEDVIEAIGGMDFGFEDPTVLLILLLKEDETVVVAKEVTWRRVSVPAILSQIKGWCEEYGVSTVWCDPSRPDLITYLQSEGVPAMPAPRVVKAQRVDIIRKLLEDKKLLIVPTARLLISQLKEYHYEIDRRKGEPTDILKDGNDDAIDALSYAVAGMSSGRVRLINAAPEATEVIAGRPYEAPQLPLSFQPIHANTEREVFEQLKQAMEALKSPFQFFIFPITRFRV